MITLGETYYWIHGEHHRFGTAMEFNDKKDKVLIDGFSSIYWMSVKVLNRKIKKPYPVGRGGPNY